MPTATDELREAITKRFGSIDVYAPLKYLLDRGYTDNAGCLHPPLDHVVTNEEAACIDFLFQEWDFAYEPQP